MTVSDAVIPFFKLWEVLITALQFMKGRAQILFDFVMDRLVTWLCRYYQRDFDFPS